MAANEGANGQYEDPNAFGNKGLSIPKKSGEVWPSRAFRGWIDVGVRTMKLVVGSVFNKYNDSSPTVDRERTSGEVNEAGGVR